MLLELVATIARNSFWPIISTLYCDIDIIDFIMKKVILAELSRIVRTSVQRNSNASSV